MLVHNTSCLNHFFLLTNATLQLTPAWLNSASPWLKIKRDTYSCRYMGLYFSCCSDGQQDGEPVGWQIWRTPSLFSPSNRGGRVEEWWLPSEGLRSGEQIHQIILLPGLPQHQITCALLGGWLEPHSPEVPMETVERVPSHSSSHSTPHIPFRSHHRCTKLSLPHPQWAWSSNHGPEMQHLQESQPI